MPKGQGRESFQSMRGGVTEQLFVVTAALSSPQTSQRYGNQSIRGSFGGQAARCREREQAVARQLVRGYISPDVAGGLGFGNQITDEIVEMLLRSGDMFIPMQERPNRCGVALVLNEGICSEDCLESLEGTARPVS